MEVAQLRELLKEQPFRPFQIRLVDGREFRIPHPEFCYIPPNMRHTIIVAPPEGDAVQWIDAIMIASVTRAESDGPGSNGVAGGGSPNGSAGS